MFGPLDLIVPPVVLITAILTAPFTILTAPFFGASRLTSWLSFKHAWFKHFWFWFGPASKPLFAGTIRPLLEQANGVVLDIGPASGIWLKDFGEIVKKNPGKITKIYGIEPNVLFHEQLRANAKLYGLEGIYQPLSAYAQDLVGKGIQKGSVDTIVTVHVLCSVGEHQDKIVKSLYEYLKPGGQWLVFEHVRSKNGPVKMWQTLYNGVWNSLLDGCELTKDTEKTLANAVEWKTVDIAPDPKDGYFETLPHTVGRLMKA